MQVAKNSASSIIVALTHALGASIVLLAAAWAIDLPSRIGMLLFQEQLLVMVLGLAVSTVFLRTNRRGEPRNAPPWYDVLIAAGVLAATLYIAMTYEALLIAAANPQWNMMLLGGFTLLTVIEAVRRMAGWVMFGIILLFVAYALTAHLVPAPLTGREMNIAYMLSYLAFDPSALLGMPMSVATTIVVLFIFFGKVLFETGGGDFFTDLAMSMVGKRRGGSAKIAVVSSALFGSISGSAVSNVATTGVVTIPLMKRSGYPATTAGAIESVASTGGQLLPPIMGAAAFLMAEFLEINYTVVIVTALFPALLYYFAVFCQIHLIAGRDDIQAVDQDLPSARKMFKKGWHFFLPFAVLIVLLFQFQMDAPQAALYATGAMFLVGMLRPYGEHRLRVWAALKTLSSSGIACVQLITIVAAAGIVIGILAATGGGFAISLSLVQLAGESAFVLLLMSGAICIILGMGMPTSGVYVLLSALIAPSLVKIGIEPLAAHMFILYFGMMSMITPPIALAAFAAASISEASPMKTGFAAMQLGWVAYVVPFLFVLSPSLIMIGAPLNIAFSLATAVIGVFLITVAMVGYLNRPLGIAMRMAFLIAGAASLAPLPATVGLGSLTVALGVLIGGGLALFCYLSNKKALLAA